MPSAIPPNLKSENGIKKLTNCRLIKGDQLVKEDLWVSSATGKILDGQREFFEKQLAPKDVIDLGGRIISPGFIECQVNGAFGFNFSQPPEDMTDYQKGLLMLNMELVKTGVTSYLPAVTSQKAEVYHQILPYLGPSGASRDPSLGTESLGAHVEGPFISPTKNGIHDPILLREPTNGFSSLQTCYGEHNLPWSTSLPSPIRTITIAPELPGALDCISAMSSRGFIVSIGHSEATFEQARRAVKKGAKMITHLFNAMRPLHHRNPGIFGLLGTPSFPASTSNTPPTTPIDGSSAKDSVELEKPYFGIIADGIHLHPTTTHLSYSSHPSGCILVTDSMHHLGLPDGLYPWTNGSLIRKTGHLLTLEGDERSEADRGKIAGSVATLIECLNNFRKWTGVSVPEAVGCITSTPARLLGLEDSKGFLKAGADADLVVLDEIDGALKVEEVWKFGVMVFNREMGRFEERMI